jgi:hypothetical protein
MHRRIQAVMRGMSSSAPARLATSVVVGVVVGLLVSLLLNLPLGVLSGFAAMAAVFVLTGVVVLWPMTADSLGTTRVARTSSR